ncbi:MAG: DM13 domain-containing protein [Candidatus Kerfeldbacteria bacterium]|nr:DM13 domain-containing protein [Candidatus Kerfeldbacteria bacterium]
MIVRIFAIAVVGLLLGAGCQRVQESRDVFPQPVVGSAGSFQEYPRWKVAGNVTVTDSRTLRFEEFTFHGDHLPAFIMLLKDRKNIGVLKELTGQRYDLDSFELSLPDEVAVSDFNLVVIYSPDIGAPVSGVKFSE